MPAVFDKRIAGAVLLFLVLMTGMARAQTGPGTLSFSPAIVTVSEGAGNAVLTVTRSLGSSGAISVSFATIDGSALAPGDYTATSGTISWADGETASKPISIPVIQNATLEGTRYFNVFLTNATGGATIATQNSGPIKAIVRIADDEPDAFPPNGALPPGFVSYGDTFVYPAAWQVTAEGYRSPLGLVSPAAIAHIVDFCDPENPPYNYYPPYCYDTTREMGFTSLSYTGDFLDGSVSFAYRVASGAEGRFDFLVDGAIKASATAQSGWQVASIPIPIGQRTLTWQFLNSALTPCSNPPEPDGLACNDRLYVDAIVLPTKASRVVLERVGGGSLTMSGQADCINIMCSYFLPLNTVVTLTATPAAGYFFGGWGGAICDGSFPCIPSSGDGCGGAAPCTLTLDQAKTVSARFLPLTPTLTTGIADVYNAGTGTITSSPGGINCPVDCTEVFANGTAVTLTATPDAGSVFTGWIGGGCSGTGTGTCTLNVSDNIRVQAIFINQFPPVTVQISGTGTGMVTSTPPGISCPGTCSFGFPLNSMVTLTATPAPGSYGGFPISCATAPASCTFSISSPVSLSVQFQTGTVPDPPTLTSALINGSSITVTFSPPANDGGVPISSYLASCGALAIGGNASPMVLTGTTPGTPYSCTVTARNAAGTSAPSNAVIASPQLALLGVVSRKPHGNAGYFEIDIDRAAALNGPVTVEPRFMGAGHQLVFDFNVDITSVAGMTASTGTTTLAWAGKKVFVSLADVPDNRRVLISLFGIVSAGGTRDENISIGFLVGDVSQSRSVTAADVSATKARNGQMVNIDNFRFDIDLSGAIDRSDVSAVKSHAGTKLP